MHFKRIRNLATIALTITAVALLSAVVLAEEVKFDGTWRTTVTPAAPAPAAPAGGRGGFGGGGGGGGAQKITLRVKTSKGKAKGNFTMGDSTNTLDINNGKIEGNKMTFKTGLSGTQIYVYEATVEGDTMTLTRSPEAAAPGAAAAPPAGGRGGGGFGGGGGKQTFTLLRDKK